MKPYFCGRGLQRRGSSGLFAPRHPDSDEPPAQRLVAMLAAIAVNSAGSIGLAACV
jgi:hypothetical protein